MSTVDYRDGFWHHVVVVVNRTNDTLYFYLDGLEKNTFDISAWSDTFDNDYPLFLAANYNKGATPDGYFNGSLDEVAIFNDALSLSDVEYIYNDGLTNDLSDYASLVTWLRMGD